MKKSDKLGLAPCLASFAEAASVRLLLDISGFDLHDAYKAQGHIMADFSFFPGNWPHQMFGHLRTQCTMQIFSAMPEKTRYFKRQKVKNRYYMRQKGNNPLF